MPTSTPAADGSSALTSSSAPSATLDICQAEQPIPQPSPSPPPPSAAASSTHSSMPSLPTRPPKKSAAPAASPTTGSQPIQADSPPTAAASTPSTSSSNSQTSQNGPSLPKRTSPAATTSRASPAQASGVSGQSPKPASLSASAAAAAAAGTSSASTSSTAAAPKGMPALPRRTPPPAVEAESEEVLRIRAQIHDIRVILVRAALRLGYSHESAIVMQASGIHNADLFNKWGASGSVSRARNACHSSIQSQYVAIGSTWSVAQPFKILLGAPCIQSWLF